MKKFLIILFVSIIFILGLGLVFMFFQNEKLQLSSNKEVIDYTQIKISVQRYERTNQQDSYELELSFVNIPNMQGNYKITTYLWNKDKGVVRTIDNRILNFVGSPDYILKMRFSAPKSELFQTDTLKLDFVDSEQENVYSTLVEFNARNPADQNSLTLMYKDKALPLTRMDDVASLERNLALLEESSEGIVLQKETDDFTGFYLSGSKISLDILYLDSFFNIVDLGKDLSPTEELESPYMQPKSKTRYIIVQHNLIDDYGIKIGDNLLLGN